MKQKTPDLKVKISERDFSKQIEDLLTLFGWQWCHFRPARTKYGWRTALSGHQGFPDYIAIRPPRLLIFELKSEAGVVSEKQQEWLDALKVSGKVEVFIWRPSDFDEVAKILRGDSI